MSGEATGAMLSTPVYAPEVSILASGRRLLVVQDAGVEEAARLHGQLSADGQAVELIALRGEAPWAGGQRGCGSTDLLEVRLLTLLSSAPVGTRLYVCGDETFAWRIYRLARNSGLLAEEIELVKAGSQRELYCVHCATMQTIGRETETTCCHCGVQLLVREHFSRRLGAYMGVCINPDQPYAENKA
ncbi:dimethylamine monooxygenase subunit DmmA family protein [Pseudomonas sp. GCM10022188]|uniref:dimethylamine monooxygenase subunit DmmA family protein n=1 Tax=Pseudomonas TaxID=286 RepID=UPI001E52EE93|nr:dimethylamine monooxygenase subunit DmmA family protein [Pseudomonas oryzagri]MCC6073652.1 hypothetical protein [Pseudomonas oryzagri]